MSGTPMQSTDFRIIVDPIMSKAFDGVYDIRKDQYKKIFNTITDVPERGYYEEPVLYGMGAAPLLPEGNAVTYQSGGVLFNKRYDYGVYGLGFALTKVLVSDGDHIQIGKIYARHLAQSGIETQETLCANVINRAFNASYAGGDGVSLSNAAHPIVGGSFSNQLTNSAALSQTSVEQMLVQILSAVDNNGKKINLESLKLVVSPSNAMQAEVIRKTVLRTGGQLNDLNPVNSMELLPEDTAVISRMTSTTQWGIQCKVETGLQWIERWPLQKTMEGDFETDSMRYKFTFRGREGWTDPRTMFMTPGL